MSKQARDWEEILRSEGMGADLPRTGRQALSSPVTYHNSEAYADSPILAKWTALTHAVEALPLDFHNRHLLVTLCEIGYVSKTALRHGVSRVTVYRSMKALERWLAREHN